MSYEKYYSGGWQSGETGGTPITPEALNHMEQGIANLDSEKAPAGYGLGENQAKMVNDANAITEIGFFQSISNTPDESQWWFILHFKHLPIYNHAKQLAFSVQNGHICVRSCYSEWQPWEWVNPPMVPGVEYRTTERWKGKAVYAICFICGEVATKSLLSIGLTEYGITEIVSVYATLGFNGESNLYGDDMNGWGISGRFSYKANPAGFYGYNGTGDTITPTVLLKYCKE